MFASTRARSDRIAAMTNARPMKMRGRQMQGCCGSLRMTYVPSGSLRRVTLGASSARSLAASDQSREGTSGGPSQLGRRRWVVATLSPFDARIERVCHGVVHLGVATDVLFAVDRNLDDVNAAGQASALDRRDDV